MFFYELVLVSVKSKWSCVCVLLVAYEYGFQSNLSGSDTTLAFFDYFHFLN